MTIEGLRPAEIDARAVALGELMRVVCFDVSGPWGMFRKPYAAVSPVSFPVPPPTALLGMVGAVCGYDKHEYHERVGWECFRAGVRLLGPVQCYRTAINLLNTRDGVEPLLGCPRGESYRIQIPFEVLAEPSFRVWIAGMTDAAADRFVERLTGDGPVYTPTLGLACCLADVRLVGEGEAAPLGTSSTAEPLRCVVPIEGSDAQVEYDPRRPYQRLRLPATMKPDREVIRYPEVVVADDAGPIVASGVERYRWHDDVFALI